MQWRWGSAEGASISVVVFERWTGSEDIEMTVEGSLASGRNNGHSLPYLKPDDAFVPALHKRFWPLFVPRCRRQQQGKRQHRNEGISGARHLSTDAGHMVTDRRAHFAAQRSANLGAVGWELVRASRERTATTAAGRRGDQLRRLVIYERHCPASPLTYEPCEKGKTILFHRDGCRLA